MTETSMTQHGPTADDGPSDRRESRLDRFEHDLEAIGHRTSSGDRKFATGGVVAMAVGVLITIVAYVVSTTQSDTRDVISSGILATVGLSVVVAGGVVFVRSSITEFLRFWMLRLLYEQQRDGRGER